MVHNFLSLYGNNVKSGIKLYHMKEGRKGGEEWERGRRKGRRVKEGGRLSTDPLHLTGIVRQAGGEGTCRVSLIVMPTDLLPQHGSEGEGAEPGSEVLARDGKTRRLQRREMLN